MDPLALIGLATIIAGGFVAGYLAVGWVMDRMRGRTPPRPPAHGPGAEHEPENGQAR